jgi:hypothetical protein
MDRYTKFVYESDIPDKEFYKISFNFSNKHVDPSHTSIERMEKYGPSFILIRPIDYGTFQNTLFCGEYLKDGYGYNPKISEFCEKYGLKITCDYNAIILYGVDDAIEQFHRNSILSNLLLL